MEFLEQNCRVPIIDQFDVIVCGGGPAGVCAAIAAGRSRAKTLLIEAQGCLGGTWTSSLMGYVIDSHGKSGIIMELEKSLEARKAINYRSATGKNFTFDIEEMKFLLEELTQEAGVEILYHTRLVGTESKQKRLCHAITESKSGRRAFAGKIFIDCTGDGDLGAAAGCQFSLGEPVSGKHQPMSFIALLSGINAHDVKEFIGGSNMASKKNLLKEFQRAGIEPSYTGPTLFFIHDGLFWLIGNHQYDFSPVSAEDITRATIQGRREVYRQVEALRSLGRPWNNLRIVATGNQIGVREGRRIKGVYEVTAADLAEGRRHENAVCSVNFGIDVHSPDPLLSKECSATTPIRAKLPYDIPIEAMISADFTNMMMAGRCISGDFLAHSSYRVTGNACPMGEYVGITAALAAKFNLQPVDVPWNRIRNQREKIIRYGLQAEIQSAV